MNGFQPPTLFPLVQYLPVPYFASPAFYENPVSPQNDDSMIKKESNGPSGINTVPCYFFTHIPESSSQEHSEGKWTITEKRLYYEFIHRWERYFPDNSERKKRFYFNAMSCFIGTRSSTQCKSHDQKVRTKKKNLNKKKRPDQKAPEKLEDLIKKEEFEV